MIELCTSNTYDITVTQTQYYIHLTYEPAKIMFIEIKTI